MESAVESAVALVKACGCEDGAGGAYEACDGGRRSSRRHRRSNGCNRIHRKQFQHGRGGDAFACAEERKHFVPCRVASSTRSFCFAASPLPQKNLCVLSELCLELVRNGDA